METIFFYFVSNVVQQEQYEALAARRPIFFQRWPITMATNKVEV